MTASDRRVVGVDLGGTKILALAVSDDGKVLGRARRSTLQDGTPIADQIGKAIERVLAKSGLSVSDIAGIGVGVPGVVDSRTDALIHAPNIEVDDPQFVETLRERYDVPVRVGNDVNLGTLAECWLGAGKGVPTVVGVFVGTGIGGGVVIGGQLRTGPEDQCGEVGHIVLMADGPRCGCGNLGCFEAIASRTAIERDIRQGIADGRESCIMEFVKGDRIKSGALAAALDAGDELTTEVMQRAGHYLGQGALTIRHLLDPEMIVFGGGVIEACADFLLPIIEAEVQGDQLRSSRRAIRIAVSIRGDDAVALGAAAFVRAAADGLSADGIRSGAAAESSEEDASVEYPRVDAAAFGSVTVNGEELPYDICIRTNGKVTKRRKKFAKREYGTSHVLGRTELEKLCKGNPSTLIIGAGFQEMVTLADDGREYLDGLGVEWTLLPTPDAVTAYNKASGPKALFLHVTC